MEEKNFTEVKFKSNIRSKQKSQQEFIVNIPNQLIQFFGTKEKALFFIDINNEYDRLASKKSKFDPMIDDSFPFPAANCFLRINIPKKKQHQYLKDFQKLDILSIESRGTRTGKARFLRLSEQTKQIIKT